MIFGNDSIFEKLWETMSCVIVRMLMTASANRSFHILEQKSWLLVQLNGLHIHVIDVLILIQLK